MLSAWHCKFYPAVRWTGLVSLPDEDTESQLGEAQGCLKPVSNPVLFQSLCLGHHSCLLLLSLSESHKASPGLKEKSRVLLVCLFVLSRLYAQCRA